MDNHVNKNIQTFIPTFKNASLKRPNKTETSKVGAISKAQKAQVFIVKEGQFLQLALFEP